MKHKIWPLVRKISVTLSISAGVLAIANIETSWQQYRHLEYQEQNRFVGPAATAPKVKPAHAFLPVDPATKLNYKPLQSALSQSLEEDELMDSSPFAHLSTFEPLQKIMQKGVAHFHREALRSPEYQDEAGYDMLAYDIEHSDGTKSGIIAYVEKSENSESKLRAVFVVFMVADGSKSDLSFFRSGALVEQSQLTVSEVQTLVAHKLGQGIPLLSVSR